MRSALDRLNGGSAPSAARTIDDLQKAASELDKASDGVAQACLKGGSHVQLIPPAKAVAKAIDVIADATASAAAPGGAKARAGGAKSGAASTNKLTVPVRVVCQTARREALAAADCAAGRAQASRTHEAIKQLIDACSSSDKGAMVARFVALVRRRRSPPDRRRSAKTIAMSCGELVGGARAMSNDLKVPHSAAPACAVDRRC